MDETKVPTDNKVSARSKVLNNWSHGWQCISKTPPILASIPAIASISKKVKRLGFNSKKLNTKKILKIRKNRKKPVKVKNLFESKSFLDFASKKFPIKEGVPFIQNRSCNELTEELDSNLNPCLDCNEKRGKSQTCRFFQYRTLIKKDDKMCFYAFAEEGNATHDDCKIWLPAPQITNCNQITAIYLLTFVGREFCRIYEEEKQLAANFWSVTWKKPVKGIRELCDVCETTIFNSHYVCAKCGLAVCIDCYGRRVSESTTLIERTAVSHNTRKNHDVFGWILCTNKEFHQLTDFHLAIFITQAVFALIDKSYHKIRNEFSIQGKCECKQLNPELNVDIRKMCAEFDIKVYIPHIPRQLLCEDKLLILKDPKCADNLKLFQIFWCKGFPVIIEKVNLSLNEKLWTPNKFNLHFGKQMSRLVNCMNGHIIPKQPMSHFWDGFEDMNQRLTDEETGEELILKLKDWPPNAEFRDMLPLWFDDLMDALPLPEYTRYNGCRNLASCLPEFFVRPDLGPKMYCAYGSVLHPDKGTTNLHLDMSDAVNVMIYVGVAHQDNIPLQTHLDGADAILLKGGCDSDMMTRANSSGLKVGALWHIWKAEDADKIRQFLNNVAKERHMRIETNNDPIHDQSWYLDQTLRTRLENEFNVKGVAIAQCLGDAILVPAGAPHQVQNIHSCIKVAGEFVSPENVFHCLAMTQQFRQLSKRHNNHEDKLQIKNIIYHTIKECLSSLMPSDFNTNLFSIPPPPKLISERLPLTANNENNNNSLEENLPTLQSRDPPKEEEEEEEELCNLMEEGEILIPSNNRNICDLSQISDKSENCMDVSLLSDSKPENDDWFEPKATDSVEVMPNVCSESTKLEENQMEITENFQSSEVSPVVAQVIPVEKPSESSNTSENILDSPPVLIPYGYPIEPVLLNEQKSETQDSTKITNSLNN